MVPIMICMRSNCPCKIRRYSYIRSFLMRQQLRINLVQLRPHRLKGGGHLGHLSSIFRQRSARSNPFVTRSVP